MEISKYKNLFNFNSERSKKVAFSSIFMFFSQIITSLFAFLTTGILARYFNPDEFGLWSFISMFSASFLGFDLGFGNALRNKLSQIYAIDKNSVESKKYYFSVFHFFLFLSLIVILLTLIIFFFMDFSKLIKIENIDASSAKILILLTIVTSLLSLVFSINIAGFFAYQESQWNAGVNTISKFLLLVLSLLSFYLKFNFLIFNILFLSIILLSSVFAFFLFINKRKWSFIYLKYNEIIANIKSLFRKSFQFSLLQFLSFLYSFLDLFIIGKISGLSLVGEYSLVKKIFMFFFALHFSLLMPLWSAYTEAAESKDIAWVEKSLKNSLKFTFILFFLLTLFITFFGKTIIYLWSSKLVGDNLMYFLFGLWSIFYSINNCFSVFLNSIGRLKYQILGNIFGVIALIIFISYFIKLYSLNGIAIALTISVFISLSINIFQTVLFLKDLKNGL